MSSAVRESCEHNVMDPTSMRQHASMFMNYPRSSDVSGNQTMVVDGTSAGTDGINMNVVDFQLGDLTDSTAVLAPQQQQQNHLPTIDKGRREKMSLGVPCLREIVLFCLKVALQCSI